MSFSAVDAYPLSPLQQLKRSLIGRSLKDVPAPAAVIDVAKTKKNCELMLDAVQKLGVKFRAHVKTHKTTELTILQVGEECRDVRLVVSTMIEAEQLVPLLLEYKSLGAKINVLYGVPVGLSQVDRLAELSHTLGQGGISVMIDHPDQLTVGGKYRNLTGFPLSVFLKTDSGTHRAGVCPTSPEMATLVEHVLQHERMGNVSFCGFYSHAGHSYAGSSPSDAMEILAHEVSTCVDAAKTRPLSRAKPLTISVGASPTILSAQNLLDSSREASEASNTLRSVLESSSSQFSLEFHAGVYPLLDMQQVETKARDFPNPTDPIALTILAEVCSLYLNRTPGMPEALISAGCLGLAREPCKDYKGWGVLAPWNGIAENQDNRLIVSRISQEHGIVAYEREGGGTLPLKYGQKVRIWPNHACITGAMYAYYLIVDSDGGNPEKVVDVWVRWRGW